MIYANLSLASLTAEQRAKTCGYWYTVSDTSTPHTAFRTRAALMAWLERRGLSLTAPLLMQGVHSYQRIDGAYQNRSHAESNAMPTAIIGQPFLKLDNGDYTEARVTDENGMRVVHFVNCNSNRVKIHWSIGREWEDAGKDGIPSIEVTQ